VTGDDTEDTACPYVGVHANKEYLAVSGCSRVPTEQEASKGQCAHWDDTCLVDELMTGSLLQGSKAILSRITVASLQDLGYSVDYTQADTYTKDNLGPNCACKTRKERSLLDMRHGETVPLGRLRAPTKNKSTPVRRLSAQAHQMAMEYGQSLLSQRSATLKDEQRRILQRGDNNDTTGSGNSLVYVGDQVVSVLVQDGGHAYGVIVHKTP
jgi:Leishmanolysin